MGRFALMEAATGGNMLYRGERERLNSDHGGDVPQATTPAVGDVFIIKTGQQVLTEK